jgi:hypothetical protein
VRTFLLLAAALFVLAGSAVAGTLTGAVGVFKFEATDYYFPNFYDEAGFRGDFDYAFGAHLRHNLRLQCYGYPGDDNIFETIIEYGFHKPLAWRGFDLIARPVAGYGVAKAQYPFPYYHKVEHQFVPWLRLGYDAYVGHKVVGPLSAYVGDRGRLLVYAGPSFAPFVDDRFVWQNAPGVELRLRVNDRWTLLGRGGVEVGGYYDKIFLTPSYLPSARPYGEVGACWDL